MEAYKEYEVEVMPRGMQCNYSLKLTLYARSINEAERDAQARLELIGYYLRTHGARLVVATPTLR